MKLLEYSETFTEDINASSIFRLNRKIKICSNKDLYVKWSLELVAKSYKFIFKLWDRTSKLYYLELCKTTISKLLNLKSPFLTKKFINSEETLSSWFEEVNKKYLMISLNIYMKVCKICLQLKMVNKFAKCEVCIHSICSHCIFKIKKCPFCRYRYLYF